MEARRKPGRPLGSLNKATIIKRREAEEAVAVEDSAPESSVQDTPPTPIPRARSPRKRVVKSAESAPPPPVSPVSSEPETPAVIPPRTPRKRARVIVMDESSSSEEYTVVRRKKPRRVPPVPEREPEPISVGGALSTHRQHMDTLKTQYEGFYRHLK